ncbi:MAG: NTP transferase domain-containing protein [Fimbriimonas sp.]
MVAIIPAGGRGTRMLSITQGRPKELLRLGRQTVIERVIREAQEVVDRVIVVSSPEKPTLSERAEALGAEVVLQHEPRGLGHAIACAQSDDDALILLADAAYLGGSPINRIDNLLRMGVSGCIAVEEVPDDQVPLYGIVEVNPGIGRIERVLEKPRLEETPSRWAIASRYGLSITLMSALAEYVEANDASAGEIGFSPFLAMVLDADLKAVAVQPGQRRFDCGDPEGYKEALGYQWDI